MTDARSPVPIAAAVRDRVQALRPQQWIKNVLVFVAPVAAHETGSGTYLAAAVTCAGFCACAAAGYVLNDLIDLPHDRRHPYKRHRALAAGRVAPRGMIGIAAVLAVAGLALGFAVSPGTGIAVLCYVLVNASYSLCLKRALFLDVMALASLYTVRVVAGALAAAVPVSPWLSAFSMLVFVALATVKRQCDAHPPNLPPDPSSTAANAGRAYRTEDRSTLAALAAAAGLASVVVLAIYVQSPAVITRYERPYVLWLICPLLTYWLGRLLLLANRGTVRGDPVAFALRDGPTWITLVAIVAAFAAAL